MKHLGLFFVLCATAGCILEIDPKASGEYACVTQEDCLENFSCVNGFCWSDGSSPTANTNTENTDSGSNLYDVSSEEAGADVDTTHNDSGAHSQSDAGMDAGVQSDGHTTSTTDAHMMQSTDTGSSQTGDAEVVMDAGTTTDTGVAMDAETPDVGPSDSGVLPDSGLFEQTIPTTLTWVYSNPTSLYFNLSEITVAQYEACVTAGSCSSNNHNTSSSNSACNYGNGTRNNHPMNCVDWDGATAFCAWAGARLPNNDEWSAEASNGGTRLYPWGDSPQATCSHVIMDDPNSGGEGCGMSSTGPVCSRPAGNSVSGVCDLAGNVTEWTTPAQSVTYVLSCGGSWNSSTQASVQASAQNPSNRNTTDYNTGFRCVAASIP